MSISTPDFLWLLLLLAPIVFILVRNYERGKHDLLLLSGRLHDRRTLNVYAVKSFFGGLFFCLFFAFTVFALSGPSWGRIPVEENRTGLDVVMAVDVSRSMLADDIRPTRLSRCRDIIRGILRELPTARYGVTVFKGSAAEVVPVTEDQASIQSLMDYLSPNILTSPGTNIAAGVETALTMFPQESGRFRAIVLFSDGENQTGDIFSAAHKAAKQDVPIFAVTAGTVEGSSIRLPDGSMVTNKNGQTVISRADPAEMHELASLSGGKSFSLSNPGTFGALVSSIQEFAGVKNTSGFRLNRGGEKGFRVTNVPRYGFFLAVALIFLLGCIAIRVVKWRDTF